MKNNDEKYFDYLYNRREYLDKTRIEISNSYDKYLLTFATGSLYLSIGFTESMKKIHNKEFLTWGWILLIISILGMLISILFSSYAFKKQIEITDKEILEENISKKNHWSFWINLFQWIATLSFIIGIIFLVKFYFINL